MKLTDTVVPSDTDFSPVIGWFPCHSTCLLCVLSCRSGWLHLHRRCLIMGRSRTSPQLRLWETPAPWLDPPTKIPPPLTTAPSLSPLTQKTRRRKIAQSDSSWLVEVIRVSKVDIYPVGWSWSRDTRNKIYWVLGWVVATVDPHASDLEQVSMSLLQSCFRKAADCSSSHQVVEPLFLSKWFV